MFLILVFLNSPSQNIGNYIFSKPYSIESLIIAPIMLSYMEYFFNTEVIYAHYF